MESTTSKKKLITPKVNPKLVTQKRRSFLRKPPATLVQVQSKSNSKNQSSHSSLFLNPYLTPLPKEVLTKTRKSQSQSKLPTLQFIRSRSRPLRSSSKISLNLEKPQKLHISSMPLSSRTKKLQKKPPRKGPLTSRNSYVHPKIIQFLSFKTLTGSAGGSPKDNNQDAFFIYNDFHRTKNQSFLGVLDGHGLFGHLVSNYVKQNLPITFQKKLPAYCNLQIVRSKADLNIQDILLIKRAIIDTYITMHSQLVEKRVIDINFSGTTAVSVLLRGSLCLCANAGDSRAIIGQFDGQWSAYSLSEDHKPENLFEQKRIEKSGGRVQPYKDLQGGDFGPPRVWLAYQDIPGLAMSRSIGDYIATYAGVIAEPDIKETYLQSTDKFLVMASDGVWEFISNEECVEIVSKYYSSRNSDEAVRELTAEATKRWSKQDEVVDDITAIIVFLV